MKKLIAIILVLLFSTAALADMVEKDKPDNCVATRASDSRDTSPASIDDDTEDNETATTVREG